MATRGIPGPLGARGMSNDTMMSHEGWAPASVAILPELQDPAYMEGPAATAGAISPKPGRQVLLLAS